MENVEVLVYSIRSIEHNTYGKPTVSNLLQENCCFATTQGNLCVYNTLSDEIHCTRLDEEIQDLKYIKYMSLYNVIFMADDFNLITYDPQTYKFHIVHSCVRKITSLSWNPNETFLVVVNNENEIYGYTFEGILNKFTALYKTHLKAKVPNSVYVGWGSHNTQFQGPKKGEVEVIKEEMQTYADPKISWRGNGEQFVVNYWKEGRRFLKVFDNSLRPLYHSDIYQNLQQPVSFKGQGNFIACAAIHNNQNKIVIFEKNCLVKTEFFVPENKGQIQEILFHPEINVLGVYSVSNDVGFLNIYVNLNAKWYLKQQLRYSADCMFKSFEWVNDHLTSVCKIGVLTSKNIEFYTFRFIINRSPNTALTAVTDGRTVHFTFFNLQIIPPPMSSTSLTFEKPINRICFHPNLKLCLFLDSCFGIKVYDFKDNKLQENFATDLSSFYIHQRSILSLLDNCWTNNLEEKNFYLDFVVDETNKLLTYQLLPYNDTMEIIPSQSLEQTKNVNLIYCTGRLIKDEFYEFCLSSTQQLLMNKIVISNSITSLFIYRNYLLLTHANSKLYCIRLTPENLNNYNWDLNEFYSRDIEQGAKIICVTDDKHVIILQLPRGNLESITCRLIAIDTVEMLLSENKWEDAVYTIRQQKLNWNILIDLDPTRFSNHIEEFVKAAKTVSVLNTIVSEFSNENCLKTMYNHCLQNISFAHIDKRKILSDILDCISQIDPVENLVSIVTIQIKHFTLKSALKSICDVFEQGNIDICKKAIHQILLYAHTKDVISETYMLYKIEFLSLVYNYCSEDPRIYEPELEKLKGLESIELRFRMNVLGKNPKGATKYLIRCPGYNEQYMADFIIKNNTYDVAYESVQPKNPNFKLITRLYAKFLSLKGRHDEAALILTRAELIEESLEEYKNALNWHQVLHLFNQLDLEETRKIETILDIADDLVVQKRIDEAVMLYEHYAGDYMKAIQVLTDYKIFQQAICLAKKYNCSDLIDNTIKPAIIEYRTNLHEKILDLGSKLATYTDRLETVRNKNFQKLKMKYTDPDNYEGNGDDDLYSDYGSTSSSRSSRSRGSTMSSRNRRKEERKKIDLREGGFYEDIALIRQLYIIIVDIFKCGSDVRDICLTLTDEKSFKYSLILHKKLNEIQEGIKKMIPKIWSETFIHASDSNDPRVLSVIQNREDLEPIYKTPPPLEAMDESWKLLVFK